MDRLDRIYVAGHRGLLGSGLVRRLEAYGYMNLITRSHAELDLTDHSTVERFFQTERPEYVFLAAARVGGIGANQKYPADFMYTNLMIETAVLHAAFRTGVKRLILYGSTCTYPRHCQQPMREVDLLTGSLEPTSEPYALAKIAGMRLCEAFNRQYGSCFISVIPPTLYGPGDNFDLESSHVISALIRKVHEAKAEQRDSVVIWGSGSPRREFLYSDDAAEGCIHLMNLEEERLREAVVETGYVINVGAGSDITISDLAHMIGETVGYGGGLIYDTTRPDGAPRKLLDSSRMTGLGWRSETPLEEGIRRTYEWYRNPR